MREQYAKLPLSEIAVVERGKFSARPRNDPRLYGGNTPFLQTGDIARAGCRITSWEQTLNEQGLAVSRLFPPDTLFMSIAANVGDVAISTFAAACPDSVVAITPKEGIDKEWLLQMLKMSKASLSSLATQNAQANLSLEKIAPFKVPVPSSTEQRAVGTLLRTWDEAIEKAEILRIAKERRLDGLRSGLLFGSVRLGRQHKNWRPRHLSEVTVELTERNGDMTLGRDSVMGVTNSAGIVPMREQTVAEDISRYKRLPPRAFAYNPMRINVGSIAMNEAEGTVLVSPDYIVFACKNDGMEPGYLDHLRKTRWWTHHIASGGSGSVRQRTYYDDLAALRLPLPEIDEQQQILRVLDAAAADMHTTERMIVALTQQKRGLMQKLLTGQWRITTGSEDG